LLFNLSRLLIYLLINISLKAGKEVFERIGDGHRRIGGHNRWGESLLSIGYAIAVSNVAIEVPNIVIKVPNVVIKVPNVAIGVLKSLKLK
jgi:hypothetical protein